MANELLNNKFNIKSWVFLLAMLLLLSCSSSQIDNDKYRQVVKESNSYMLEEIDKCVKEYKISEYKRFDWNQQTGELVWSDAGVPKVVAKVQFVGSISTINNTWLWSWANPSIIADAKTDILKVKAYGEQHHFKKLTTEGWPAEEADGWEMTAIAAKLLKAKGAYRAPNSNGNGFTFLIIKDIKWAK